MSRQEKETKAAKEVVQGQSIHPQRYELIMLLFLSTSPRPLHPPLPPLLLLPHWSTPWLSTPDHGMMLSVPRAHRVSDQSQFSSHTDSGPKSIPLNL